MIVLILLAFVGMLTGIFLILGMTPFTFAEELTKPLSGRRQPISKRIQQVNHPKEPKGIRKTVLEAREMLILTGKGGKFAAICAFSLFLAAMGAVICIVIQNYFMLPVLAAGMGLLPFWYVLFTSHSYKKLMNNEIETGLSIKGHKIELVVLLTAFYGLRRSEVIGLKWSAFDFNHNCFSIRHTVTTCNVKGERVTIKKDKAKNKSSLRTYPLIPFLKERLLEAKKQQEENRKLCGRAYNKEYLGYVCVDVIGNLIKPNYVSSTFGKLLAKNNLRHIRFHDLRHTCASLLLANGVPMEQVKEWLGHSEISTTVDIYGHLQYVTKKQSAAAIEQDIVAPMLQNLSAVSP